MGDIAKEKKLKRPKGLCTLQARDVIARKCNKVYCTPTFNRPKKLINLEDFAS